MIVRDYCGNGMTAVSMAEELFPQFGSSEAQCTKDPNKLMLGRTQKVLKKMETDVYINYMQWFTLTSKKNV